MAWKSCIPQAAVKPPNENMSDVCCGAAADQHLSLLSSLYASNRLRDLQSYWVLSMRSRAEAAAYWLDQLCTWTELPSASHSQLAPEWWRVLEDLYPASVDRWAPLAASAQLQELRECRRQGEKPDPGCCALITAETSFPEVCAWVCTTYGSVPAGIVKAAEQRRWRAVKTLLVMQPSQKCIGLLQLACKWGNLDLIGWIRSHPDLHPFKPVLLGGSMVMAARWGHAHILKWALKNLPDQHLDVSSQNILADPAEQGDLLTIQYEFQLAHVKEADSAWMYRL